MSKITITVESEDAVSTVIHQGNGILSIEVKNKEEKQDNSSRVQFTNAGLVTTGTLDIREVNKIIESLETKLDAAETTIAQNLKYRMED